MRSFIKTWSSFISRNGRECVAPSLAVLSAHQDGGRICRPQREARRGTLTHSHHKKLWSDPAAWAAGARLPPLIAYIHMCLLQREETGIGIEGNSEGCTACARKHTAAPENAWSSGQHHTKLQNKTGIRSTKKVHFAHDCIQQSAHNRQKAAGNTEHARGSRNQCGNNLITQWLPWLGMT